MCVQWSLMVVLLPGRDVLCFRVIPFEKEGFFLSQVAVDGGQRFEGAERTKLEDEIFVSQVPSMKAW